MNNALGGEIHKRMHPEQKIINHIDVKPIDEYSSKVEKLGGKVVAPKTVVPGMGYFAFCLDTENNKFSISLLFNIQFLLILTMVLVSHNCYHCYRLCYRCYLPITSVTIVL